MSPKAKESIMIFFSVIATTLIIVHILGWVGIKAVWLYAVGAVLGIIIGATWYKFDLGRK